MQHRKEVRLCIMKMSVVLSAALMLGFTSRAETLSFAEVWRKVSESSAAQEGAKLKVESVTEALARAEHHWLPKVYLDARTYRTNDPGAAFFGLLEQRRVEAADFSPSSLNRPDAQTFTRGALGLDLALYEGGAKRAQAEMFRHMVAAEKLDATQTEIEQYAQSGVAYGSVISTQKQKAKLRKLNEEINRLMKGYRLGERSNPVGYSGLLGMKSLANRVGSLIEQLEAREKASYGALSAMGVGESGWTPKDLDARSFVDQYMKPPDHAESYGSQAGVEAAEAVRHASRMERARHLPRVGAFAESYAFNGNRDGANGYTAGLYLQWSLFDPADYGRYREARLGAMASAKFNQAFVQRLNAEREDLLAMDQALRANLARLDDSDGLLSEQTRVSSTLFKNGSINALQFVEILNRRTDLISQQAEAEMSLLKTAAERIKKSKFVIGDAAKDGGPK